MEAASSPRWIVRTVNDSSPVEPSGSFFVLDPSLPECDGLPFCPPDPVASSIAKQNTCRGDRSSVPRLIERIDDLSIEKVDDALRLALIARIVRYHTDRNALIMKLPQELHNELPIP